VIYSYSERVAGPENENSEYSGERHALLSYVPPVKGRLS